MAVCPVCNGMTGVEKKCPECGREMLDAGVIQDYYDPYSAYLEQGIYEDGYGCNNGRHCVHLFACPECHYDARLVFKKL
ncbi:MAG: hypothetical protein HPY89_05650 [Pelotomaculum sp.]|uniref:Uncharacterized protein n=1 Tax=Pelotomaculum thermopropionicum (strain DSM 13744 / JCM 10971 / SI) TaxID=370438 RepID=A5D1H0_PELTS|nr:hypothetical protein [Pelotomaculum sp.]BAF59913.1 hypothetical protein PTH_1732 [Pelotomaculum thermopropionicum SI]